MKKTTFDNLDTDAMVAGIAQKAEEGIKKALAEYDTWEKFEDKVLDTLYETFYDQAWDIAVEDIGHDYGVGRGWLEDLSAKFMEMRGAK